MRPPAKLANRLVLLETDLCCGNPPPPNKNTLIYLDLLGFTLTLVFQLPISGSSFPGRTRKDLKKIKKGLDPP